MPATVPPPRPGASRGLAAAVLVLLAVPALPGLGVRAQSVLERPPNMPGTWAGRTGTVYFNFNHRFSASDAPQRKIINYPTFLLGTTLGDQALVGLRYGTRSDLVNGIPNEWEAFARWTPLSQAGGAPVDLSLQGGYNHAAESGDGALTVARELGERVRILAQGRAFSDAFASGESRGAWSVGGVLRLSRNVALAADYAELFDRDSEAEEGAWSAGLQLGIPYTPHTFSVQAGNATTTTLQGASVGADETRWGFEFTIPITLSRYIGGGGGGGDAPQERRPEARGDVAAEVGMTNQLRFTPDTVRISVGETVRWTNDSDLLHTVTLDPSRALDASNVKMPEGASTFDSGNMQPGAVFEHTFDTPGEYQYVCVPHEPAGMIGVVIVTGS